MIKYPNALGTHRQPRLIPPSSFAARAADAAYQYWQSGKLRTQPTIDDVWPALKRNPLYRDIQAATRALGRHTNDDQMSAGYPEYFNADDLAAAYDSAVDISTECPVRIAVAGWMKANVPTGVLPMEKPDMLLPSTLAYSERDHHRFSALPSQIELPAFAADRKHGGMMPLEIFLLDNLQVRSGGPAAPLAQRLFVTALALAPLNIPTLGVVFERSAKAVFDVLYPVGMRRYARWIPLLQQAATELYANGWVPYIDPVTRRTLKIQPVITTAIPTTSVMDPVGFLVRLPRSATSGPMVNPRLMQYGQTRRLAFNALLQLAYHWHAPGVTIVKAKSSNRWARAYDWSRYEPYSRTEIAQLVAPTSTNRVARQNFHKGIKTLTALADAHEIDMLQVSPTEWKFRPHLPEEQPNS